MVSGVCENFNRILNDRTKKKGPKASFLFSILRSLTQDYYAKYLERINDLNIVNRSEEENDGKRRIFESEKKKFKKAAELFLEKEELKDFMEYNPVIQQIIHRDYDERDDEDE